MLAKGEILIFTATGFLLLVLAFLPLSPKKLAKTAGIFFLLAFLTAGLTSAVYYLSWYSWGLYPGAGGILLINLFALFFLGELGWGLLHRLVWERSCLIPIRLSFAGKTKEMVALLDTGNLLVDPLTKTPVVLVEAAALQDIIPERIASYRRLSLPVIFLPVPTGTLMAAGRKGLGCSLLPASVKQKDLCWGCAPMNC